MMRRGRRRRRRRKGKREREEEACYDEADPAPARAIVPDETPPLHRRQAHRNSNKIGVPLTRVDACWGECARVMEVEARTRTRPRSLASRVMGA
jgi:hypothetical protein